MSSNRTKLNFRQASLNNCDSPKIRRNSLKKQSSEDNSIQRNNFFNSEIKVTVSSKCKVDRNDYIPPKIAWVESEHHHQQQQQQTSQTIVGVKCQENKKLPRALTRQPSIQRDSILSSKEDLIGKLRQLLKEDEDVPEKPNLNIFLTQNITEDNTNQNFEITKRKPVKIEEKIGDDGLTLKYTSDCNSATTLFQFRKPIHKNLDLYEQNQREPNILVTPIKEPQEDKTQDSNMEINDNSQPINNIIIRPSTAAMKRDLFKKRTNSAFNSVVASNNQRPPLLRSASAPIKPDHGKSKFLASKRKLKNSRKKDFKSAKKGSEDLNDGEDKESVDNNSYCMSENVAEIVTMVSLVSPAASDVEEIPEIEKEETKERSKNTSPKKCKPSAKETESVPKVPSFRKVVKQVSFQQSSIHTLRSFSAGFAGRRNSMATSMALGAAASTKRANTIEKNQEKRVTSNDNPDDDERVPKRRLLRNHSARVQIVRPDDQLDTDRSLSPLPNDETGQISIDIIDQSQLGIENEQKLLSTRIENNELQSKPENRSTFLTNDVEFEDNPQFSSAKEKECWNLYQKMSTSGVKVKYDTLLRGMLTPTEYRNRRQSVSIENLLNNPEQSTDDT